MGNLSEHANRANNFRTVTLTELFKSVISYISSVTLFGCSAISHQNNSSLVHQQPPSPPPILPSRSPPICQEAAAWPTFTGNSTRATTKTSAGIVAAATIPCTSASRSRTAATLSSTRWGQARFRPPGSPRINLQGMFSSAVICISTFTH